MAAVSRVVLEVTKAATQLIWETTSERCQDGGLPIAFDRFYLREECDPQCVTLGTIKTDRLGRFLLERSAAKDAGHIHVPRRR
jgi:hypothetical protein